MYRFTGSAQTAIDYNSTNGAGATAGAGFGAAEPGWSSSGCVRVEDMGRADRAARPAADRPLNLSDRSSPKANPASPVTTAAQPVTPRFGNSRPQTRKRPSART
jgi:hypothetical protein